MKPERVEPESILVAVPALNEEAHVGECLRSLLDGSEEMRRVRIVVADGGSRDATCAVVQKLSDAFDNIELISNPKRLQSAAVNQVVAQCAEPQHAILVRCDAHATYPPRFVLRVADSLAGREADALVVAMDAVGTGCFAEAAAWVVDTPLGSGGSAHRGGRTSSYVDHGHHAGFRLDWFRTIGGYDETFSHNEDAEFDYRLALAGGRIWLDADIRLNYHMRPTLRALVRQYWHYGRGRACTVLKHGLVLRARQAIPVATLCILTLSISLVPVSQYYLLPAAGYLLLLAATSFLIAVRRRSLCGLWTGPALAAIHLAWAAGFVRQVLGGGGRR